MKITCGSVIIVNRTIEILLVALYNLALLAGASFLVYYKDASPWVFALALCFGASWKEKKDDEEKV